MTWLSDDAVARLQAVAEEPDFSGTRYRIIRELGRGGMGVVYEAEERDLQRRVAVKVLATELARDGAERMRREARLIARLEHPGIVPVHDIGTLPDGRVYYAMKLVRGTTLGAFARGATPTEVLRLFLRACEAVAFAHAAGTVHCDLKPQNVMVGELGAVLVMDWGGGATEGYMAPEQASGGAVDARADVHALGAMLRELVSERPKRLEAICAKATASDPNDRYPTARELAADVARYLDGQAVEAHRESPLERAARWLDRNRALIAVVTAYLIMRVIVFFAVRR